MNSKEESESKLIENQMEVKICDTIMRFEEKNYHIRKKFHYKLTFFLGGKSIIRDVSISSTQPSISEKKMN